MALLCAAKELGIDHFPQVAPWHGEPLTANMNCENRLFAHTGTGVPGIALSGRGYSMPARLAAVGGTLGLKNPTVYIRPGFYATMITTFSAAALREGRESGLPIHDTVPPPLQPWQRALKVMAVMKVVGLHYVMQRPDGSFMDPADGENHADFDAMNASWAKCYADTGISLVFDSEWVNLEPLV